MKHNLKITMVLLAMFLVTQFIGLYVVNHYTLGKDTLPFGMEQPKVEKQSDYPPLLLGLLIAFVLAIFIFFFLTKFKMELILRLWFFFVIVISLAISIFTLTSKFDYL